MKDLYKVRRHIEKDLFNRLKKNNGKLDFERLWHQFSKRTLSNGIDREMYRAYLGQKVLESKIIFNEQEDTYSFNNEQERKKFIHSDVDNGYWEVLSKLTSEYASNRKKHQKYFQLDSEKRQKYFDEIKMLNQEKEEILKNIGRVCKKYSLGLNFLKSRLSGSDYRVIEG